MSRVYWLSLQQKILLGRDGYLEGGGVSPILYFLPSSARKVSPLAGLPDQFTSHRRTSLRSSLHTYTYTQTHTLQTKDPHSVPLPSPTSHKQFRPKARQFCSVAASPTESGSSLGEKRMKARGRHCRRPPSHPQSLSLLPLGSLLLRSTRPRQARPATCPHL